MTITTHLIFPSRHLTWIVSFSVSSIPAWYTPVCIVELDCDHLLDQKEKSQREKMTYFDTTIWPSFQLFCDCFRVLSGRFISPSSLLNWQCWSNDEICQRHTFLLRQYTIPLSPLQSRQLSPWGPLREDGDCEAGWRTGVYPVSICPSLQWPFSHLTL